MPSTAAPRRRPRPSAKPSSTAFYADLRGTGDKVDVVVFAAPQLSLIEMQQLAGLLDGRRVHGATSLIVATSPEIKFAADRMGLTRRIEDAGGIVAAGVCFYQSYAREMAEANGWQRLLTNSAKLVNIIAGYGYKPTLASMERCVDSAVAGKIVHDRRSCLNVPQAGIGPCRHRNGAGRGRQFFGALRSRSPQRHVLAPRAQASARATSGKSWFWCRQGRRRLGLDAARDGGARHGAQGHPVRPRQHHPGAGRHLRGTALVDRFERATPPRLIRTGDEIRVEPDKGLVDDPQSRLTAHT